MTFFCIYSQAYPTQLEHENQKELEESIDITSMSIEELLEVEVTSASKKSESLFEAPGIMVVVPREEIEIYGDRNLHQLLQRQPSIYTRGSYMYPNNLASFRGNMPTHLDLHNLILFNGRPIRESGFGGINFPVYTTFPLESLQSVEIIRGPGSVLYGTNAFTGVINLRTKKIPDKDEFSASGMLGSHGYYDSTATAAGKRGNLGFFSAFRVTGQNGYSYRLTDGMGVYDTDPDKNKSISGVAHLENGGFTFDVYATHLETFHVGVLPFWAVPGHVYRVNKLFANAGYQAELNKKMKFELNFTYNLHENDFAGFPTGDVSLNSSDILGEATVFVNPIDNMNLILGYLLEYQSSREGNALETVPIFHKRPQSAYFQGDYKIGKIVKIIAGVQWQRSGQGVNDFVSRYGLVITPFKNWGFKLLRGEAFRAPFALETDLYDIPVLVGNEDLEPETITTYDAQVFYSDDKTYAAATYFDSKIEQLIIRDNSVAPTSFKNGGAQNFRGVEFEFKRVLTPHWHALGSYMYQKSDQDDDINISTVPNDMFKLGIGYTQEWGTVGIFYNYFGNPPRLNTETVVNPKPGRMHLASINVRIDPAHWIGGKKNKMLFTFRVENLFNEKINVPEFNRGGNPNSLPDGPGATFYAGLRVNF